MSYRTNVCSAGGHIQAGLALASLAALLAGCADPPPGLTPTTPSLTKASGGATGTVLFESNQSGEQRIYVMDTDGANIRQLTDGSGVDEAPSYAPGNKKFVFVRKEPGAPGGAIMTASANGGKPTPLTPASLLAANPEFSPDGTRIAFDAFVPNENKRNVFVMNADGTGVTQITIGPGPFIDPSWSLDGQYVAVSNDKVGDGSWGIVSVNVRTHAAIRRVDCPALGCGEPAYSPVDTNRIVFTSVDRNRLVMWDNAIGAYVFTGPQPKVGRPAWSADGALVLYHSELLGTVDLYAAPASYTSGDAPYLRLTSLGGNESAPATSR